MIQTEKITRKSPLALAIAPGLRKMPDPITFPTTTAMAIRGPRARTNEGWVVEEFGTGGVVGDILRVRPEGPSLDRSVLLEADSIILGSLGECDERFTVTDLRTPGRE